MIWLQLLVVLVAIIIGARIGGVGLGVMGAIGLAVLTFVFGLQPASPPIDVMLIITAVITAAAAMHAAGGLDYLVSVATKILVKHPSRITYLGPAVTYLATFVAGTGHVSYSLLPVIAEVARKTGIRPERPLSIAVIASQQAITASPVSAATAAMIALLSPMGVMTYHILGIAIPATIIGVLAGAFFASKMGKELKDDPEYQKRLAEGVFDNGKQTEIKDSTPEAKRSVLIFVLGVVAVVVLGSIPSLMPSWTVNGQTVTLRMTELIEIGMLCTAALIVILCKAKVDLIGKSSVFSAGMQAVIAIFGIAWMGDTFIAANLEFLKSGLVDIVQQYPYSFALILFVMSILLYSQAATVKALLPLGISLGLPAASLIAMYPAVNGYFFIPNYPTLVAAINFASTGTTRIGKYVLNHSFMIPGLVSTVVAIAAGFLIASVVM